MTHKHKMVIIHGGPTIAFTCEIHWCDVEIYVSRGNLRQMTVRRRPWLNRFKRGGNYPLLRGGAS